jgi:hypothetical protein
VAYVSVHHPNLTNNHTLDGAGYAMVVDCQVSLWDVTLVKHHGGGHQIISAQSLAEGMDSVYLSSPLADNVDGFVSANVWANLFTTASLLKSEEFLKRLDLELPMRALSFAAPFTKPIPPTTLDIYDVTTTMYPAFLLYFQAALFSLLLLVSTGIAVLTYAVRSERVTVRPLVGETTTRAALAQAQLTQPVYPVVNGVLSSQEQQRLALERHLLDPYERFADGNGQVPLDLEASIMTSGCGPYV